MNSTIIMLDSPSPPPRSPSPSGGLDPSSGLMINRAENFGAGNRHINPFASGYNTTKKKHNLLTHQNYNLTN